jgi:hypothetical protein
MPGAAYSRLVARVWDRLETRARELHPTLEWVAPFYLDARHLAAWCPRCGEGTVRVSFIDGDPPMVCIDSERGGPQRCSHGCTEAEIGEWL